MKTSLLTTAFVLTALLLQAQWTYTNLQEPKSRMGVVSHDGKAYFAGGATDTEYLTLVEIYDVVQGTWSYTDLSFGRMITDAVACGNRLFFAGGLRVPVTYDIVDIYDTETGQWSVSNLSESRFAISAVAHEGTQKVLFAGGINLITNSGTAKVDIYDMATGTWTTSSLSIGRGCMASAVVGDVAIFAGGTDLTWVYDQVDMYNFVTDTWTSAILSEARFYLAGAASGNAAIFAGGMTTLDDPNSASYVVDKYDAVTNTWSTDAFLSPRAFFEDAPVYDNRAYFVGGGAFVSAAGDFLTSVPNVDIYDFETGQWTNDALMHDRVWHSVTAAGHYILAAGGWSSSAPYACFTEVEMYDCLWSGIGREEVENTEIRISPNPGNGKFYIEIPGDDLAESIVVDVFNLQGQPVLKQTLPPGERFINLSAPAGTNMLTIQREKGRFSKLLIIR